MVSRTGFDVSGATTSASASADGIGCGLRRHAEHRQQETGVVEPGGGAVVGGAVDVDEQRVDAGLVDTERRSLRGAQRDRSA